ncbi:nucleoside phosphorylase domain-containing protein [Lipomyces oligophaga]|uniref:nucleoside phosphorylase domain-containing protein n=1 Tax=Lipomyces oligophaga TaxID=45792 RepID=UPI0034CD98DC
MYTLRSTFQVSKEIMAEQQKSTQERALAVIEFIKLKVPVELQVPKVAVICGSGLQNLTDALQLSPRVELNYGEIPYFSQTTVEGHAGKLVFGFFGTVPAVCMVGRVHFYEGNPLEASVFPIRVFSVMGVEFLIVTNASGGLNPAYKVGDFMILNDHINFPGLAGWHPLRGPNDSSFGPRFPALSDAYDLNLRQIAFKAVSKLSLVRGVHEGVYAFVSGPTYETRAESRMLLNLGADCVGMSTVPEIIVARHSGLKVLAISLVTNEVVTKPMPKANEQTDLSAGKANHEEVIAAATAAGQDMQKLVCEIITSI